MKRTLIIIAVMLLCLVSEAQPKYIYCEMTSSKMPPPSNAVVILVDYGQDAVYSGLQSLRDEEGNILNFNSHIDALNFMSGNGWEYVQMYLTGEKQNNVTIHWIMRMDITNLTRKQITYLLSVFKTPITQ